MKFFLLILLASCMIGVLMRNRSPNMRHLAVGFVCVFTCFAYFFLNQI